MFLFLVEMALGGSNAFWEMRIDGNGADTWPGDEVSIFYGLFPRGDNRTNTTSVEILDKLSLGEIFSNDRIELGLVCQDFSSGRPCGIGNSNVP